MITRKLLDLVIKLYITKCTDEELYINKKMNIIYFRIRSCLMKKTKQELEVLHDYLKELEDKTYISLSDLFHESDHLRKEKVTEYDKKKSEHIKSEQLATKERFLQL